MIYLISYLIIAFIFAGFFAVASTIIDLKYQSNIIIEIIVGLLWIILIPYLIGCGVARMITKPKK